MINDHDDNDNLNSEKITGEVDPRWWSAIDDHNDDANDDVIFDEITDEVDPARHPHNHFRSPSISMVRVFHQLRFSLDSILLRIDEM